MNKKDILIVCALEQETNNELDDWNIIYTGVGKINSTYELTAELFFSKDMTGRLKNLPKLVINFGTAGSKDIPIHTLVDCTKFIQRDMDVTGLGFMKNQTPFEEEVPIILDYDHVQFNPIGRKTVCGTGDNFVQDDTDTYSDVFDMEAYALAKVCYMYDVPFISFKYITDNANEHSAGDWEQNCSDGIVKFKEEVLDEIKR